MIYLLLSLFITSGSASLRSLMSNQPLCEFRFQQSIPQIPLYPQKTGDVVLNRDKEGKLNEIVLKDGTQLNSGQGCNSFDVEWLGRDGKLKKTFQGANGQPVPINQVFYVHGHELRRRTLQDNWSTLPVILSGRKIKMDIICNNVVRSCLEFTVKPKEWKIHGSKLISKFQAQHAGGVHGVIKAVYPHTKNPMLAKVDVDLDLSNLDIEAIKSKYPKCSYDKKAMTFLWHIHAKWNNQQDSGFLGACSPSQTGGHYDPTFACGPASQYKKDTTCTAKKDWPYQCSPSTFAKAGYVCEVGDMSGKFGKLHLKDSKIQTSYLDYFFAPKDLYNKPMYNEPNLQWNFLLHLACPEHKNPRILCAKAKLYDN